MVGSRYAAQPLYMPLIFSGLSLTSENLMSINDRANIHDARILVVDDNIDNVDLLIAVLHQAGYSDVNSTTDPFAVESLHAREGYDLILLDMQMPGLDGLDVIKALRDIEQNAYVPVLAITANASYKIDALRAGARDFITKPFDLAELLQRIHNLLEVRLLYRHFAEQGKLQRHMALHDALTGLPNRRLLEDRIGMALSQARRNARVMGLLYLDLDGFKAINDRRGHEAGDRLLRMVAERLATNTRAQDTVARIGGDEFIMVLADLSNADDVMHPAVKILDALAQPFDIDGARLQVTVSIGIAAYPHDGHDANTLIACADQALRDAKAAGRNRFHFAPARCVNAVSLSTIALRETTTKSPTPLLEPNPCN